MTACEAGHTDVIDVLLDLVSDKERMKLLEYTCESGSPLHAAVTSGAAKSL